MEDIYNYILDNIYIFCLLLILVFVLIIFIMYLVKCNKGKNNENDYTDSTIKPKEELEKISDEEIEKRVIEEYKEETRELDKKLDKLKENYKDNTSVEEIIDSLKDAKEKVASDELKKFEDKQEQNAIISYKQLVESVRGSEPTEDVVKEEKETNDTMKLIEKYENLNMEIDEEPVVEKIDKKDYSYKPNEFISPVFGRMDSSHVKYREGLSYTDKVKKEEYPKEEYLEDYKHISKYYNDNNNSNDEYKSRFTKLDSEEFLKNLKEFRKNL